MADQLLEAHAPESFFERVAALEPGEVARLRGGVAVKHLALEDARLAWQVGRPSNWRRGEVDFEGESYRTVEEAVRAAFRASAESTDPDSIAGTTRLSRWAPLEYEGGSELRIRDWTLDGKAIVSPPNAPGSTQTVSPERLIRRNTLLEGVLSEIEGALIEAEVGKPGTNWKQVKGEDRKRINPIVRHYGKMTHGFTQCVADNTKRFGKEGAERVCAVVKDMGKKTTHWRKGGKVKEEEVDYWTGRLLEAAGGDVDGLEAMMLAYVLAEAR